jgi:hypothetical protein
MLSWTNGFPLLCDALKCCNGTKFGTITTRPASQGWRKSCTSQQSRARLQGLEAAQ